MPRSRRRFASCAALVALALAAPAFAATDPPVVLAVDATETPRHLLHVREIVPVKPGTLALAYPEWIPGEHAPTGPITDVLNLHVRAGATELPWRRDDVEMFVVRCEVPAGVAEVQVTFDFALSSSLNGYSSASAATPQLLLLSWNQVLVYPAGRPSDAIPFRASVTLPRGWLYGTPLPVAHEEGGTVSFETVSLTTLVDSPVLSGEHFRRVDLAPGATPHYYLDMAADGEAALAIADSDVVALRHLVREAQAFFGGWHHGGYHFLLSLSDHVAHFGLEHHAASDDRVPERMWLDADIRNDNSTLLAHELSHSWNGKYRRPAGLATPDYLAPMKDELLWVYEGLTNYCGWLLASRSGFRSTAEGLDALATIAASLDAQRGRDWRPLVDTGVEAQWLYPARDAWTNARRSVDFYEEGQLIWMEADVLIRRQSHGAKSLDDFTHLFHGGTGPAELKPYTFGDVVQALNTVLPYDWAAFLRERIYKVQTRAPLGGITGGGWTVAWSDTLSPMAKSSEEASEKVDERFTIGVTLRRKDDAILDVVPGSPAARVGVPPETKLVAVNGRAWTRHLLRDAIRAADAAHPVELLVQDGDIFKTYPVAWPGGLRYPVLKRIAGTPDLLSEILRAHAPN